MKSFNEYLTEVNSLDTLKDPGIRNYMSRKGVTQGNRYDFETLRKIFLITLQSGSSGRRRLNQLLRSLASAVPEIKPLVNELGFFNAQDGLDAKKLFEPEDVKGLSSATAEEEEEDDIVGDEWESHPRHGLS